MVYDVNNFHEEVLTLLEPCGFDWVVFLVLDFLNLLIKLGVLDFQVGFFNELRNLFELIKGVVRVVKHDSAKYFSEVSVKVMLDGSSVVLGLLQLKLDSIESFKSYAHILEIIKVLY